MSNALKMYIARWICLIPAALGSWYTVLIMGALAYNYVEKIMCTPHDMISGLCINDTVTLWLNGLTHFAVGLSAVIVELTAALIAPNHKEHVTWATLVIGLLIAGYMAFIIKAWSLLTVAAISGIAGALLIVRFLRTSAHSDDGCLKY